jgi:hypothetical protein
MWKREKMSEMRRRRDFLKMALGAAAITAIPRGVSARAGALGAGPGGNAILAGVLDDLYSGLQLYFGDLHGHTAYSDGFGTPPLFYDYGTARGLDFCAVSDHAEWVNYFQDHLPMEDGSPVPLWPNIVNEVTARYVPGTFVPFPAFEWTSDHYGHRTVVFASPDQVPSTIPSSTSHPAPPALWAALAPYTAMTIPHHVTRWGSLMDWSYYNPALDRLVEIYSKWGNGANVYTTYEPMTKYLQYPYLRPLAAGSSVEAMLDLGYKMGIVAATDSHQGHPGSTAHDDMMGTKLPKDMYPTTGEEFLALIDKGYRYDLREPLGGGGGLAGVWAPRLTREAIWEGLYARRTVGTTGIRPVVKFGVIDGADPRSGGTMGDELTVTGSPTLLASVVPVSGSTVTQVTFFNTNKRILTALNPAPGATVALQDTTLAVGETACYRALILIHQNPNSNFDGDTLLHSPLPQLNEQVWTSPIWVTRVA